MVKVQRGLRLRQATESHGAKFRASGLKPSWAGFTSRPESQELEELEIRTQGVLDRLGFREDPVSLVASQEARGQELGFWCLADAWGSGVPHIAMKTSMRSSTSLEQL